MADEIKVKRTSEVPVSDIQRIYYSSTSHTQASKELSHTYGFSDRAWRYALRKMEEHGFLEPNMLPEFKQRDMGKIEQIRKDLGVKGVKVPPKKVEKVPENFVMLTVHFKIAYTKIGARGFHPFFLEGYFSKITKKDSVYFMINDMMNWVQERLSSDFRELVGYLELKKEDYEEGIEVEELTETRRHDGDFRYVHGRTKEDARI
jgi:hypothetical protein